MRKKMLISGMTLIIVVFAITMSINAITEIDSKTTFVQSFAAIYDNNSTTEYQMINLQGQDITEKFIQDTQAWYKRGKYSDIYDYFCANIETMTEIKPSYTRSLDLTKTVTQRVQKTCTWSGNAYPAYAGVINQNNNGVVAYYIRGSITYNPNTYIVSSIGTPIRTSDLIKVSGWREGLEPYVSNETYTKGATGNLYGKFTYMVTIDSWFQVDGVQLCRLTYDTYSSTIRIDAGE
ncbi:MAG: hypothetical protein VB078_08520 [Clostridiaceae bacterium]|nr:hypothetical protein [Clostridiaceae bacterium]